MSTQRQLTQKERDGLYEILKGLDRLDTIARAMRSAGVQWELDLGALEDGREVIRALATDTRSLVREPDHA
jgi:hypothetical protein